METITKEEITKYFGSVGEYIQYLNTKIQVLKKNHELLWIMKPYEVFTQDVREMAINNKSFETAIVEGHKALIKVFADQLLDLYQNLEYVENMVESEKAFEKAINSGRLSNDKTAENYAGKYMYMGSHNGKDAFKNSVTRKYIE